MFTVDIHRTYINPRGVKRVDWYTSAYCMDSTDIDHITKEWLEEWKGSFVDLSDSEEEATKDKGKGKEKAGEKQEKEQVGEKHKALQEDQPQQKRTKTKAHRLTSYVHLGLDDYGLITTWVQKSLEPPMTATITMQTSMKSALDMQISELKTIVERASQLTTKKPSMSGSLRGDLTSQERTRVIRIMPTSMRIPPSVEVEQVGFIEVDLTGIPIESLQLVQTQVQEELKEHELITHAQNEKLQKENYQLQLQNRTISVKLVEKEEEEHMLKQVVTDLCAELPQCHINLEALLLQKVKVIIGRAREIEAKVEKMDVEYKARIAELESREPMISLNNVRLEFKN